MPVVAAALLVAFLLLKGWQGLFPWERHYWQRRQQPPDESSEPEV